MTARFSGILLAVSILAALAVSALAGAVSSESKGTSAESKVTVGSPSTPYLPNGSNEPALAMDANHPAVLAAGANDLVDSSPCKGSSCDLTPDIGISGIYFSFDSGGTWTQPTYTGLTAQNGTTHVGPDPHAAQVLRERDVLARRPGARVRPEARPGRVLVGERLAAVLRQPRLPGQRADAVHRRLGGRRVTHRQRAGGSGR